MGDERKGHRLLRERYPPGPRAEFDRAAQDAFEFPQLRIANMREGDPDRSDFASGDSSRRLQDRCDPKLRVVLHALPGDADQVELEDDAFRPGMRIQAQALVDEMGVAQNKRQGLSERSGR